MSKQSPVETILRTTLRIRDEYKEKYNRSKIEEEKLLLKGSIIFADGLLIESLEISEQTYKRMTTARLMTDIKLRFGA